MNWFKNLSNLKQRIIGAIALGVIGILFFIDLFKPGQNLFATLLLTLFSFGILKELFDLFFKSKNEWTKKKRLLFGLSFFVYGIALFGLNQAISLDSTKMPGTEYLGGFLILIILLLTIITDSSAYFIGKKFGKKKFAPTISPGKTWAGFWGGLLIPAGIGFVYTLTLMILKSQHGQDNLNIIAPFMALISIALLSIIVQLGDLFESYIKRLNNVKDSGNIIPGHGGLLDRFDGFLFLFFWLTLIWMVF